MQRLTSSVTRLRVGVWLCRTPVVLSWTNGPSLELLPGMVYEAGVRYRGVDVATMLDNWLAWGRLPPNVNIRVP
jgi:hypothetical protein